MDWIKNLNEAITYMEEHMTEDIKYKQVAKIACCSSYHFQRMFAHIAGVPLSEYIRRRKMSLAAVDLQDRGMKIIDIAFKYGYSSPTAFNRAFQSVHGIAPSRVKKGGALLKSYPPVSFKLIAKGVEELEFRIEQKEAIRLLGVSTPLAQDFEEACERFWLKVLTEGSPEGFIDAEGSLLNDLNKICNAAPEGAFGIIIDGDEMPEKDWTYEDCRYFIGMPSTFAQDKFEEFIIPALTWAIFPGSSFFSDEIKTLDERIYTEWLPTSGYEFVEGFDVHFIPPTDALENAAFEIWVPVRKKQG